LDRLKLAALELAAQELEARELEDVANREEVLSYDKTRSERVLYRRLYLVQQMLY
jgi:hypothetical protein